MADLPPGSADSAVPLVPEDPGLTGASGLTVASGVTGPAGLGVPEGTTELGIDIINVERIGDTLSRFGARFAKRVLTEREAAYVRGRPETLAGRWAAKEAVSKVLGLGVRGVGWREIEIVRLPTGQPAVSLAGRALARARQLGMGRIAVSISHERDYAVAIAFGIRAEGGAYVFPPGLEERLGERERRLTERLLRLRRAEREGPREREPEADGGD